MSESDARAACCQDFDNRELVEVSITPTGLLEKQRCTVCDRNHYVATGNPVEFGVVGAEAR